MKKLEFNIPEPHIIRNTVICEPKWYAKMLESMREDSELPWYGFKLVANQYCDTDMAYAFDSDGKITTIILKS